MTRPSSQPMNRSELYRWVMALGFCAYDMLLYLDTHPDDAQALSYYNQCNELYNSAKKTYEERFEPLSAFGSQPLEDWDWNDGPMPWNYEKRLQYPISISTPNAKMASFIISQYGGPDGEMGASMRYLAQRFSFANPRIAGVLTDIGTEELAHLEMIGAIVRQPPRGLSAKELEASGFAPYYIDHTAGVWPQAAGGVPFSATEFQSSGDAIADLVEDMAAEGAIV